MTLFELRKGSVPYTQNVYCKKFPLTCGIFAGKGDLVRSFVSKGAYLIY